MIDAGADKIEVTSFVNPKAVPQMANAKDLVALVQPYAKEKGCQTIGLALNKRGVDDAVAAGVDYVGFGISVSEEHNKRNSNRKKINFDVCGLSFRHFVLFFAVVFASAYLGFMPTVIHLFQFGRCLYCNYICRVCSLSYGSRPVSFSGLEIPFLF